MTSHYSAFILLVLTVVAVSNFVSAVLVSTKVGILKGKLAVTRDGREFYEWLGVPYAEPPLGPLRFEPPVPAKKRDGVIPAITYASKCPQVEIAFNTLAGSEDCLYLNIYSPMLPNGNRTERLPVIVFIHGGFFATGSAKDFQPSYFMDNDVVFVTINYRLGVLGFLNTGDKLARGNMGLKDQSLALKWVYENIDEFGGDPKRITLMGESAGGIAVHMHMLSPMSQPYIHKAISESGTALAYWGIYKDPKSQAAWLAKETACPSDTTTRLVGCLRTKPLEDIFAYYRSQNLFTGRPSLTRDKLFVPTIESVQDSETFLGTAPEKLVKEGKFAKIPWLVGSNSGEGLLNCAPYFRNKSARAEVKTDFRKLAIGAMGLEPNELKFAEEIRDYYFSNISLADIQSDEGFLRIRDLFSDRNYYYGTQKSIVEHGSVAPAYVYYYNKTGDFSYFDIIGSIKGYLPAGIEIALGVGSMWIAENLLQKMPTTYGVSHADELFILAPTPNNIITQKNRDYNFSKDFVKLWVQFASSEDGREQLEFQGKNFTRFDPRNQFTHFAINDEPSSGLIEVPFKERYFFWDEFYKKAWGQ